MSHSQQVIDYRNRKLALISAQQIIPRVSCNRCQRPEQVCFCQKLESFDTNTHFCLLMHPREARKEKIGTGRMSHLCLKNSQIIVDEQFTDNKMVNDLIESPLYTCMILYPGESAHNITLSPLPASDPKKKLLIFVIDGTWSCAKSMMRDSINLHHLPKISFDSKRVSRFRIKHQPASFCLSTIESIYYLLGDMGKWGMETFGVEQQALLDGLDRLCEIQIQCSQDPSRQHYRHGQFRMPTDRQMSKKWESRKICFDPKNYINQINFKTSH